MRVSSLLSRLRCPHVVLEPINCNPCFKRSYGASGFGMGSSSSGAGLLSRGGALFLAELLSLSSQSRALPLGAQLHGKSIKLGFKDDVFVQNNLIIMYSRCGVVEGGLKVFDELLHRNLVSWTSLISGAVHNGEFDIGLRIFLELLRSGLRPNEFSIGSVLKACNFVATYDLGLCIHSLVVKLGMEEDPFFGSSMLSLYSKWDCIEEAEHIFLGMENCDVGCWNAMIGGYVQCGLGLEALRLVSSMRVEEIGMDELTLISAFKGCTLDCDLGYGRQLHGLMVRNELNYSIPMMNSLMDMYVKNGKISCALKIFDRMQRKDVVSWNTIFGALHEEDDLIKVAGLFRNFMLTGMMPTHVTFSILFRLCGNLCGLNLGLQFFTLAVHLGLLYTTSVICMFARCGEILMARLVFESIPIKTIDDCNELIAGYNFNMCYAEALKVFCNIFISGIEANECTFSSILETCSGSGNLEVGRRVHGAILKCAFSRDKYVCSSLVKFYVVAGCLKDAFRCFDALEKKDLACWGTIISTLIHGGFHNEAIRFLNCLLEAGEQPDEFIFGSVFNSCADISSYHQTKGLHSLATKMGYAAHPFVASSIIDAYAKCGDIVRARLAFNQSLSSGDTVIYNSMIMAYTHHGLVKEALDIFDKMKLANLCPSQATFVAVLSACSHMGFVDQGYELFQSMKSDYALEPSPGIFGCLVDMLSRNGNLEVAKSVIERMPFPPWPGIYRSFLSGCRIYGNREMGELACQMLHQLVPGNDAAHVLLFKVYLEAGSWEDAEHLRQHMIESGISKVPGYSWM